MSDLVRVTSQDAGAIWRVTFGASKGNILDRADDGRARPRLRGRAAAAGAEGDLPRRRRRALLVRRVRARSTCRARSGRCWRNFAISSSTCSTATSSSSRPCGDSASVAASNWPASAIACSRAATRSSASRRSRSASSRPSPRSCCRARRPGARRGPVPHGPDRRRRPRRRRWAWSTRSRTATRRDAAIAWARTHFAARSAVEPALRGAGGSRGPAARIRAELPVLEALYLDELMATADANEGLRAFLEKRPPAWRHA